MIVLSTNKFNLSTNKNDHSTKNWLKFGRKKKHDLC